jgi:hypothetical protein
MTIARSFFLTVAMSAGAGGMFMAQAAADEAATPIERGRELFVRAWRPYDERTPNGDGLGPMHNAQSCADCHHQAGVGGGGGLVHNVDLLILFPPERIDRLDRSQRLKFVERIRKIHAGLVGNRLTVLPAITLHKFADNPAYDKWRIALLMLLEP